MTPVKSVVAATLLSTAMLGCLVHAGPVADRGAEQTSVALAAEAESPAEKELRIVQFGTQSAVWNMNRSRTIEATVSFVWKDGTPRSLVLTVGPGQKVPYKAIQDGVNSRIVGARYVN